MLKKEWTDGELLEILDMRVNGLSFRAIGNEFGVSRSSIAGIVFRINRDYKASEARCRNIEPHKARHF